MTEAAPLALLLEDHGLIAIDVETTLSGGGFDVVTFYTCVEAVLIVAPTRVSKVGDR
jgi:hypothetical protein